MTTDEAKLLELADENVAAARLLLENGFPAIASSRAYYAMFTAAEAILLSKDLSFSRHSAVIAAFGQHFAKTGLVPVHLHRAILTAQEDRQAADYGGDREVTRDDAERHIGNAEEFVRTARSYLEKEAGAGNE
ncbi:MAG: HEPN domain-containing protein [Gemmatimonadetes bacterium]|nr:HEPN domain-containing protein [Gemmatimonadota bacterium]